MPEELTPEQRIARQRARREAEAQAKADKERDLEERAQAIAAQGKINLERARFVARVGNRLDPFLQVFVSGATIGVLLFLIGWCMKPQTAEERGVDKCTIEAQLAGKDGGNPNFKYAEAESPSKAKLWFSKNGVYWSTTYFCD